MNEDSLVYDSTLFYFFQHKLASERPSVRVQLRPFEMCCKKVMPSKVAPNLPKGVYLVREENGVHYTGMMRCKNGFACPYCSSIILSQARNKIACAIEHKRAQGEVAFMLTLTVPHLVRQTCKEVTDYLFAVKKRFFSRAKKAITEQFWQDVGITDHVCVCEYTYSNHNGWHPHFHCLYWLPRKNLQRVLDWEEKLRETWKKHCLKVAAKMFAHDPNLLKYFSAAFDNNIGIHISKKNGKITEAQTSNYISGWGSDREVTGNYRKKASHANHYTPHQMLEFAYKGSNKYWKLYLEYALAIKTPPFHHTTMYSNGFGKRIKQWLQLDAAKGYVKKKDAPQVIIWFTLEQWNCLCSEYDYNARANILYLASRASPELLFDYLDGCQISYSLPMELMTFNTDEREEMKA